MGRCQGFPGLSGRGRLDLTSTKAKISDYKIREGVPQGFQYFCLTKKHLCS